MTEARPRVLIIDDSPEDTETFRRYLWNTVDILVADQGERGLTLAATRRPDAVLLDYLLPDMTGLECLDQRGPGHDDRLPPA